MFQNVLKIWKLSVSSFRRYKGKRGDAAKIDPHNQSRARVSGGLTPAGNSLPYYPDGDTCVIIRLTVHVRTYDIICHMILWPDRSGHPFDSDILWSQVHPTFCQEIRDEPSSSNTSCRGIQQILEHFSLDPDESLIVPCEFVCQHACL